MSGVIVSRAGRSDTSPTEPARRPRSAGTIMINLQLIVHTCALVILISLANLALLVALALKPINEGWSWALACGTA